MLLGWTYNY